MLFKQQAFCFKRCWHAPYLDNVGKSLVSRQSWRWTTLPRKPVYVKATKPLAHSLFSFFPLNQKLTSDSCCRTPSPPSQNTQKRLTLHKSSDFSLTGHVMLSVFETEAWILLGIPMMLPVCLSMSLRTLLINSLYSAVIGLSALLKSPQFPQPWRWVEGFQHMGEVV